jgi:coproporphyrinogen III oxidase
VSTRDESTADPKVVEAGHAGEKAPTSVYDGAMSLREDAAGYFMKLQDGITEGLSGVDGNRFWEDMWERDGGGGGRTRVLEDGKVFEKGGVNFSSVHGNLPEEFADEIPRGTGTEFFATGISLVIHPRNPMVPIVHANFRYLERGDAQWFGGGVDLSPSYPNEEDCVHFHRTLKAACDLHDAGYYTRFKKWCDDYFTIRHRNEMRGIGGVFFDYLEGDMAEIFSFVQSVGDAFLPAYLPVVERRRVEPYGKREQKFQAIRRGRYAEFNLVYDRGTNFGLKTRGRIESILMSLPPMARWVYDYRPEVGSAEESAARFFQPRDWV